jgi:hypothetical protein
MFNNSALYRHSVFFVYDSHNKIRLVHLKGLNQAFVLTNTTCLAFFVKQEVTPVYAVQMNDVIQRVQ